MARLVVVRHGESTWNAEGRWQGQADPPLSPRGVVQAREAARQVGGIDAVWTSDLLRAARTAALIGEATGVAVRPDTRLRERRAGPWEGSTRAEIEAAWPGYLAEGRRPPGFEDDESVLRRAAAALLDAGSALDRAGGTGAAVVVTHSGVLRVLVASVGGVVDRRLGNLTGWTFEVDGASFGLAGTVRLAR